MKKTLVYLEKNKLEPKGGPYAVGYYIYKELKRLGDTKVNFIDSDNELSHKSSSIDYNGKKISFDRIKHIVGRYLRYSKAFREGGQSIVDLNQYDIVHFHHTRAMYEIRQSLDVYKGITILTSHSPVPLSREIYDEQLTKFEKIVMEKFYSKLIKMDEYAFNRADIILFPCEEAEEPYINNWDDYRSIRERMKNRYVYIPTGIPASQAKRTRSKVRNELNIPENSFIISYVGRHNYVKGYDQLRLIGKKILEVDDCWVVVAGKEGPLTRLDNGRWIEVGWTNDAHSYISASDVFVLPNKETYFDIVMLEVLSLGQIVIASRTGGNKYYEKIGAPGVFLYNSIDEAVELIKKVKEMSIEQRQYLGLSNKKLFEERFTDKQYVKSYLELLGRL